MANSGNDILRKLVLYLVPMILSLSVHEFAHALVATRLGDDTPEREERLTLSPAAHIDLFGSILIPVISIVTTGAAFIGWAKPVNITPSHFRRGVNMRTGLAIASAAGPLSNLLLAILAMGLIVLTTRFGWLTGASPMQIALAQLLRAFFSINVGLCVFNFLPIPPLDGSRLLPRSLDDLVEKMGNYSFMLIILVMMAPPLRGALIEWPMEMLTRGILSLFGAR